MTENKETPQTAQETKKIEADKKHDIKPKEKSVKQPAAKSPKEIWLAS